MRCRLTRLSNWDHPRMRGEHHRLHNNPFNETGSSPHARGTRIRSTEDAEHRGIIPACAGNTPAISSKPKSTRDHPRMRGEHNQAAQMSTDLTGSSPHARGTRYGIHHHIPHLRIIPACAGNTHSAERIARRSRDHPRMRGEHHDTEWFSLWRWGSSPHARGTPDRHANRNQESADHPRMRGEHLCPSPVRIFREGSSPHARGTLRIPGRMRSVLRIIPACAGNTAFREDSEGYRRDHPRMRGEHTKKIA